MFCLSRRQAEIRNGLSAALPNAARVRSLHATLLRRLSNDRRTSTRMPVHRPA